MNHLSHPGWPSPFSTWATSPGGRVHQRPGVVALGMPARSWLLHLVVFQATLFILIAASPCRAGWQLVRPPDGNPAMVEEGAAAEDSTGTLWFAAGTRVLRYDGLTLESLSNVEGWPQAVFFSDVVVASNGDVWFGTFGSGVARYSAGQWKFFGTPEGIPLIAPILLADRTGRIWAITMDNNSSWNGISMFVDGSWRSFGGRADPSFGGVSSITESLSGEIWAGGTRVRRYDEATSQWVTMLEWGADRIVSAHDGSIWVHGYATIWRYQNSEWRQALPSEGAPEYTLSMAADSHGRMWFSGGLGVDSYDDENGWHHHDPASGAPVNAREIMEDHEGRMWFSYGDLGSDRERTTRFDGARWRDVADEFGLPSRSFQPVIVDRSGNVWGAILEFPGGLIRFDGSSWRPTTSAELGIFNTPRRLFETRDGSVWLGGTAVRFDGREFIQMAPNNGVPDINALALLEDLSGGVWFAAMNGVGRLLNGKWQTFTALEGAPDSWPSGAALDSAGNVWFVSNSSFNRNVFRYDGTRWRHFGPADGVPDYSLWIVVDRSGVIWVAGSRVGRYDGVAWTTYGSAEGLSGVESMLATRDSAVWFETEDHLVRHHHGQFARITVGNPDDLIGALFEDREGSIWAATTFGGVHRWTAGTWKSFPLGRELPASVSVIGQDRRGHFWFGHAGGARLTRFDGVSWGTYGVEDGLVPGSNAVIYEDRTGELWFCSSGGITRHEPDLRAPSTRVVLRPRRASTSHYQNVAFAVTHGEEGVSYAFSLDGAESPWSAQNVWVNPSVPDGDHVLIARTRDRIGNVDSVGVTLQLEIDAVPPVAIIDIPASGQVARDSLRIAGRVDDQRFREYFLEIRPASNAPWGPAGTLLIARSTVPQARGEVGVLDTRNLADGPYDLRLTVVDTLGLQGAAQITIIVDNQAPFSSQTAPAVVPLQGGDLYTTRAQVHVYFPPNAFAREATVHIDSVTIELPDTLQGGLARVSAGWDIHWGDVALAKPATLSMRFAHPVDLPEIPAIYAESDGGTWQRLGGTLDATSVTTLIQNARRYAVFAAPLQSHGSKVLSSIRLLPRVFSPQGSLSSREAQISFTLGQSATVTVKVFNRAGRAIHTVVDAGQFGPGINVVRWDGHGRDGAIVESGLYLVTVQALGETRTGTIAVVN